MKIIDYHIHTHHSGDCEQDMEKAVLKAIEMELDEICFCDHFEVNYPHYDFSLDIDAYYEEVKLMQKKYQHKIKILFGVEIGLDIDYQNEINTFVKKYPFDFVIGSIHSIHGQEFYAPAHFFDDKTKDQAHEDFFEATLKCVQTFDCFDVLGHLDYIVRYGPYNDKSIDYIKHQNIIDEILKTLIQKNKGIEINTSGYLSYQTEGFPKFDIVKRYFDLGGQLITVGSDAHVKERIGQNCQKTLEAIEKLKYKVQ